MNAPKKSQIAMINTRDALSIVFTTIGEPRTFSKSDPMTAVLLDMIKQGSSEEELLQYINQVKTKLHDAAKALGDDNLVRVEHGVVTYNGEQVRNSLTDRMLEMLEDGHDLSPMVNFLNNLMQNPSMRAVNELYGFLEAGSLPITPDGCFLAYKAVRHDFKDIHSNSIDNSVGRRVTMPRNAVDDDKDRTCSYGLHFCSVDYLKSFARADGHVMILKINPKDVVSIPSDYNNTKGRCCAYDVVSEYKDFDYRNPNKDMDLFNKPVAVAYGAAKSTAPDSTGDKGVTSSVIDELDIKFRDMGAAGVVMLVDGVRVFANKDYAVVEQYAKSQYGLQVEDVQRLQQEYLMDSQDGSGMSI